MPARTLMIQGTSSSVGKSLLTAGLCRIFRRRGLRVAPFKAQNMSNNAAVCPEGAEIGRAQAVQAAACRIEPSADMNPVLLKPEGNTRSQVIVLGRPWQSLSAMSIQSRKREFWSIVTAALDRLRARFDLVLIEGAGSPVELNLAEGDIVNMAIAGHAQSPVLLAGDIDRGGIFAQMLGTLGLFTPPQRALVKGLIVNKFRGDARLFEDGVRILEERGGVPVLGVVPFLTGMDLPEEDAVALDQLSQAAGRALEPRGAIDIAIIKMPHIANFDDFDPLCRDSGVKVRYVARTEDLGRPDAVILPGTKTTMADLAWLRERGLGQAVCDLAGGGTAIAGICGGYQMLGRVVRDRQRVESSVAEMPGLGLLPIDTDFAGEKATFQVQARIVGGPGWLASLADAVVEGYEIHMGQSLSPSPWLEVRRRIGGVATDGSVSDNAKVWGCYLHGLFANDRFRRAWLDSLSDAGGLASLALRTHRTAHGILEESLDRLADHLEAVLEMGKLERVIAEGGGS